MSEKPLAVRVAEAIGWTECAPFEADGIYDYENWVGENPDVEGMEAHTFVPSYDTDWSATGPLIEKYQINLEANSDSWDAYNYPAGLSREIASGPTPLLAVCSLILALHAAGKV